MAVPAGIIISRHCLKLLETKDESAEESFSASGHDCDGVK
jgi:hypothetical protein